MSEEEDFTEALRSSLLTISPPDTPSLLRAGVRNGRRRRRRRAVALGVSGAAVLALVGLCATAVPGLLSDGRGTARTTPGTSAPTSPSATPRPTFTGALPADQALDRLTALLPAGLTSSTPPGSGHSGQLWVDDGQGKSLLEVHVSRQTSTTELRQHVFADVKPSPQGTLIQSRQSPDGHQTVNVLNPDGLYVTLMTWQSPTQNGPSTRPTPLLPLDQLRTMATSPKWR
ncbi:hypothetical protein [Streptomyces griseorubiginosus]|uniref:hypothetical protein n=1 Tax=Streptomyces griseorubiginosus TaxID=67304 RepID=UPI00076D4CA4|nr:hypothetical protein [Streptomyces griseorubiginosus]KUM68667.1 hypothetical protein AQI84_37135 [Streptomyces griseorubiginosus]